MVIQCIPDTQAWATMSRWRRGRALWALWNYLQRLDYLQRLQQGSLIKPDVPGQFTRDPGKSYKCHGIYLALGLGCLQYTRDGRVARHEAIS